MNKQVIRQILLILLIISSIYFYGQLANYHCFIVVVSSYPLACYCFCGSYIPGDQELVLR